MIELVKKIRKQREDYFFEKFKNIHEKKVLNRIKRLWEKLTCDLNKEQIEYIKQLIKKG